MPKKNRKTLEGNLNDCSKVEYSNKCIKTEYLEEKGSKVELVDERSIKESFTFTLKNEIELVKKHKNDIIATGTFDFLKHYGVSLEQTKYLKLVNPKNLQKDFLDVKEKTKINLRALSTLKILEVIEEKQLFRQKYIDFLKNERSADLFGAVLNFVNNKKVFDELYYWIPGKRITNIFSFIHKAMPEFAFLYKMYLNRCYTTNYKSIHPDSYLCEMSKKTDLEQLELMYADKEIFRNEIITRPEWLEDWTEEMENKSYVFNGEPLFNTVNLEKNNFILKNTEILENLKETKEIGGDLEAELSEELSYVEFKIGKTPFLMTLSEFRRRFM